MTRQSGARWGAELSARLRALVEYDEALQDGAISPGHAALHRALAMTARAWQRSFASLHLMGEAVGDPTSAAMLAKLSTLVDVAFDAIAIASRRRPAEPRRPALGHLRGTDVADARTSLRLCRLAAAHVRSQARSETENSLGRRAELMTLRAERAWANPILRLHLEAAGRSY